MSSFACTRPDCTVAVTGVCLKLHSPLQDCPTILFEEPDAGKPRELPNLASTSMRATSSGFEMGSEEASAVMAATYTNVIGVLGEAETGKTCMLCGLYLLASCGQLAPTYRFAGSLTLPGFESRLRAYRAWTGPNLPDRIAPRTEYGEPRKPGFLHLALRSSSTSLLNLLMTDLPGEWTSNAVKNRRGAQGLTFLTRADSVVLAVLATDLLNPLTRAAKLQTTRVLLQRLLGDVGLDRHTPIILAVTRCDLTDGRTPPAAFDVSATAAALGFSNVATIGIASFSANPSVPSGLGLPDLLRAAGYGQQTLPSSPIRETGSRLFQQFRSDSSRARS